MTTEGVFAVVRYDEAKLSIEMAREEAIEECARVCDPISPECAAKIRALASPAMQKPVDTAARSLTDAEIQAIAARHEVFGFGLYGFARAVISSVQEPKP